MSSEPTSDITTGDGVTIAKTVASPEVILAIVESRGLTKQIGYASIDLLTCRCYVAQVLAISPPNAHLIHCHVCIVFRYPHL